jgi:hypothetical protein
MITCAVCADMVLARFTATAAGAAAGAAAAAAAAALGYLCMQLLSIDFGAKIQIGCDRLC